MGDISNLITDMTIKGAPNEELARAVRHSMVVIDAEKHSLNWRESSRANGIPQLKARYQGKTNAGAATLISRAKSQARVPERKQGFSIDPVTGEKIHRLTGALDQKGKPKTTKSTKLAETNNAFSLVSDHGGTRMEAIYATHSNNLKALANKARKEVANTPLLETNPSAKKAFAPEVQSLLDKLNIAEKNRPLERHAQALANATVSAKRASNPDMDEIELKKVKAQALAEARIRTGANKKEKRVEITPEEWHAIQSGAISTSRLKNILDNTDLEKVKEFATPRSKTLMTTAKTSRAQALLRSGYTQKEVADQIGVSLSTLKRSLGGDG
jgi:hypothetical protein